MTIFKTMPSGRAGGKNYLRKLIKEANESIEKRTWIPEEKRKELMKQIADSFAKNLDENIKGKQEYEKYFLGNFEIKPEITRSDGIDRTLKVHARFGFDTGYMHHKKKRIDKKWSKNPDYYITRSVKRDYMPIIQTAVA